jgi:hypothetical protein
MSTFGMSGTEIWKHNLKAFEDVAAGMKQTVAQLQTVVGEAPSLLDALALRPDPQSAEIASALQDAVLGLEEALHYTTPAEWNQDFGYEGILQMLDHTDAMLRAGLVQQDSSFEPTDNPYQYFDSSPFHLVVGSYLAAIGVFTNAWFLARVHLLRLDELLFKGKTLAG